MESSIQPAENPKDVKMLHAAIKRWPKRWRGLSDEFKDNIVAGLGEAQAACRTALAAADSPDSAVKASSAIANIARTAVMIEGQTQVDDWNQDKNDRLDEGKATEIHQFQPGKVNRLPLPASLEDAPSDSGSTTRSD